MMGLADGDLFANSKARTQGRRGYGFAGLNFAGRMPAKERLGIEGERG